MKFPPAADSRGQLHQLTNGSYISLMESGDRELRKNAFQNLYGVYGGSRSALAAMLNAEIRKCVFFARARRYDSTLASAMHPVEVPEPVYHNLLAAVEGNLDKLHRYMALRKRVMGLEELHMYDIYAPMLPEAGQVIPFQIGRASCRERV